MTLLNQLINVGSQGKEVSESGLNFLLSVIKGAEPRDQLETMLLAQMGAVHMATMTLARRLAHTETITQQDSAERAFNKLARTFTTQMETLKRYRSGGEQRVVVQHQHVNVTADRAAVQVNGAAPGGAGAMMETEERAHAKDQAALAYAPGAPMLCPDTARDAVRGACSEGQGAVPDARRGVRQRRSD